MKPLYWVGFALLGLMLGMLAGWLWREYQPSSGTELIIPPEQSQLPDFQYPDLEGKLRLSTEWQDQILVLNFWATWCPPCRKETPMFVELQEHYQTDQVQFVGIAIDDPEQVRTFADTYGVNYPILLGNLPAMTLARQLGNRFDALPYTLVAAPGGKVIFRQQGEVHRTTLEPILQQLITGNADQHRLHKSPPADAGHSPR
ncbi:MAG: TlpA disulfide reductase family protein [Pseudomonadota bacterium]